MRSVVKGIVAALLAAMPLSASADEKVLNLYSWANIFDDATLQGFTKNTGYKVRYDTFDSDEMLEAKLLAGSTGYDLVTPAAIPFLQRQIAAGIFQKYDPAQVPNAKKMDPDITALLKVSDPDLGYSVVGAWGTTGMGLNTAKISAVLPDAPFESYDLLFKPENAAKLSQCGFAIIDSATDIVPIVIKYLGLNPDELSEDNVDKAMEVLRAIRPHITYIDTMKYPIELANGSICATIGWSGDILKANQSAQQAKNGVALRYVIPKEGSIAWMTTFAVPKDAPHPEAAFAFMNHLLDPQVTAHMAEITGFVPPIPEMRQYLPADLAQNEALFPPDEVKKRLFTGTAQSEKRMRYLNRQWARFRAGE